MENKNIIQRYKEWKLEKIKKWAQWYADFIIKRLEESTSDWEFNFWLTKGYMHNDYMIETYDFYLE